MKCSNQKTQTGSMDTKTIPLGFPGGAVVGSLPANAGDTGSSPGLGGSHMPRSGWAREPQITEPACLEPLLRSKRGHDSERPAQRDEEWSPLEKKKKQKKQKNEKNNTLIYAVYERPNSDLGTHRD